MIRTEFKGGRLDGAEVPQEFLLGQTWKVIEMKPDGGLMLAPVEVTKPEPSNEVLVKFFFIGVLTGGTLMLAAVILSRF